jgi:hypothetical protein
MDRLISEFTQDEKKRFRKYADIIMGCKGRIDILTQEELDDLQTLLKKNVIIQSTFVKAD